MCFSNNEDYNGEYDYGWDWHYNSEGHEIVRYFYYDEGVAHSWCEVWEYDEETQYWNSFWGYDKEVEED